jgi:two-component system KDP operon response regulator KdpE
MPSNARPVRSEESEPAVRVLVVEDDPQMRKLVRISLTANGYRVLEAETGKAGLQQTTAHQPNLVLLDLGLPDMDGMDVVRALREWSRVPIVVLSARGNEESKVRALDEGADDYVAKPFGMSELLARMRVALRHAASTNDTQATTVAIGAELTVDLAKRLVLRRGQEVHLTPIEYKLLVTLVKHAGMVLTHRQLLDRVWGEGHAERVEYLRVYMTQLRRKLENNPATPKHLRTELGIGYRLKIDA